VFDESVNYNCLYMDVGVIVKIIKVNCLFLYHSI